MSAAAPVDSEEAAVAEFGRRATRLRGAVAGVGFGLPLAGSLWLASALGKRLVKARAPAWTYELAMRHRVPIEEIRKWTELWS